MASRKPQLKRGNVVGRVTAVYGSPASRYDVQVPGRVDIHGNPVPYGKIQAMDGLQLRIGDQVEIEHESHARIGNAMPIVMGRAGRQVSNQSDDSSTFDGWPFFGFSGARTRAAGTVEKWPSFRSGPSQIATLADSAAIRCDSESVYALDRSAANGVDFQLKIMDFFGARVAALDMIVGAPSTMSLSGGFAYVTLGGGVSKVKPGATGIPTLEWASQIFNTIASDAVVIGASVWNASIKMEAP